MDVCAESKTVETSKPPMDFDFSSQIGEVYQGPAVAKDLIVLSMPCSLLARLCAKHETSEQQNTILDK